MRRRYPGDPIEESSDEDPYWEDGINIEDGEALMKINYQLYKAHQYYDEVLLRSTNPENMKEALHVLCCLPLCNLPDAVWALSFNNDLPTPASSCPEVIPGGRGCYSDIQNE